MELAVWLVPEMTQDEYNNVLPSCLKHFQAVSLRMASHLQLTCDNINLANWTGAQILSHDPKTAREGARLLHERLIRLRPNERTKFEQFLLDDDVLMQELSLFCEMEPPCKVWRGNGKFSALFQCLACRFLAQPDSVLDCEGVHAAWQWIHYMKRGLSFHLLNAILKLKSHLDWFNEFPDMADLLPYYEQVQTLRRRALEQARIDGVVAGLETSHIYQERFNLLPQDARLLRAAAGKAEEHQTPDNAWSNYVRFLFVPGSFYQFHKLDGSEFLFVAENKSFPGRLHIPSEDEACGRDLSVAWFSPVAGPMG